jgi:signal transduction histidine kinase
MDIQKLRLKKQLTNLIKYLLVSDIIETLPMFLKSIFKNNPSTTPKSKTTIEALWRLQKIILDSLDIREVVQKIVDGLLTELGYLNLGYRIIVLTLVDEEKKVLKRISLSNTAEAGKALAASPIPFHEIAIPLDATDNLLIKTLNEQKPHATNNWPELFTPILKPEEALNNQTAAGIKTSMIYPVVVKEKSIGVLIFSMIKDEKDVSEEEKELIRGFTDIVGLAIQNSQLYSAQERTSLELKQANEKLKNLDHLKDEFVSLASHELRTPMTAIKSYLWLFLQYNVTQLNPKEKLYISRAYEATDRLIALVNDMLNVSRIESGRMTLVFKPLNIPELGKEVLDELAPTAQKQKVTLALEPASDALPHVDADSNKIREVLINLLGNSLKFTDEGGKITLKMHADNDMFIVDVVDTGKGIKQEDMQKLFQKFGIINDNYLQRPNTQGTGLGLYISKSIVQLHGGKIWVASEGENKGTTFSFSLKIHNTEPAVQSTLPITSDRTAPAITQPVQPSLTTSQAQTV